MPCIQTAPKRIKYCQENVHLKFLFLSLPSLMPLSCALKDRLQSILLPFPSCLIPSALLLHSLYCSYLFEHRNIWLSFVFCWPRWKYFWPLQTACLSGPTSVEQKFIYGLEELNRPSSRWDSPPRLKRQIRGWGFPVSSHSTALTKS